MTVPANPTPTTTLAMHPKVTAGVLAGALTIIAAWALSQFAHVEIPGYVSSAVTTVLTAVVSYIVPSA